MLSEESCHDILSFAKLQPNSFNKISQTISFAGDFNKEGCYIFKVNDEIINALNLDGTSRSTIFSIKESSDNNAILCTHNKSYNIIESETSNTLLILPDVELNFHQKDENESYLSRQLSISSTCNKLYEVSLRRAKVGEVYKILQNSICYHHLEDEIMDKQYFHFQSLLDSVIMSGEELKIALQELKVYQINGKLRMLNIDYLSDIILKILECSFENDFSLWNLSQNNVHVMLDCLFPGEILDQTLHFYFEKLSINENDGDTFWKSNEFEISRCFAEKILSHVKELQLEEFVSQWNKSLPEELNGRIDNLRGLALINDNVQPQTIKLLKVSMLPDEAEARFQELFSHKTHWKQDELEGFIHDIVPEKSSASQLLLRFCRCTNSGNSKTFSKR